MVRILVRVAALVRGGGGWQQAEGQHDAGGKGGAESSRPERRRHRPGEGTRLNRRLLP